MEKLLAKRKLLLLHLLIFKAMNWGKKLIIGMVLFMIFIVTLGTIMIMKGKDDSLIENDYYEKGQTFDKDYNAKQRAIDDLVIPSININDLGLTITFPVPVTYKLICRRSSDKDLDKTFDGSTDEDRNIQVLKSELEPGPWLIRIEYAASGKNYLFETEIDMP
ncbi:MAG: FixH family protein [Daejeonella sp.]|nr:FixH family protein [Daejeonella sp.]